MKKRPILFSTEMVKAILEGRKTQTRRVIKPQPKTQHRSDTRLEFYARRGENWEVKDKWTGDGFSILDSFKCPYGQPGDALWVRETWQPSASGAYVHFKADIIGVDAGKGWKPSIHMPKDACRIFLRITNVRVERLQEISEKDAIGEGIEKSEFGFKNYDKRYPVSDYMGGGNEAYRSFKSLWTSINGEQSWNDNPWVWVIEFERVEGGEL